MAENDMIGMFSWMLFFEEGTRTSKSGIRAGLLGNNMIWNLKRPLIYQ